jgi:hypothetical protein
MFVLTRVPHQAVQELGTTVRLRPFIDADPPAVADFWHVNLNRWPARGNLAPRVIDGMLTGPQSLILSAPQPNKQKSATLEAA